MSLDFNTVDTLRKNHPGWRLLLADSSPMVTSFLHKTFIEPNVIDAEIARVKSGDLSLLDDTALKDRFQQFVSMARELLSDFREVEQNFRSLDRQVRERVTLFEGAKGELLDQILGERDAIADSDQGRSFRAFWDFLMSQSRQEEFSRLLIQTLRLPAIALTQPDKRLQRVHYDWLDASEHTQRTVAQLSQQLLGWSNEAKIAALQAKSRILEDRLRDLGAEIGHLQEKLKETKERRDTLNTLAAYTEFRDIDWQPLAIEITNLNEEKRRLEQSSDILCDE
jgi:hypothetical protein